MGCRHEEGWGSPVDSFEKRFGRRGDNLDEDSAPQSASTTLNVFAKFIAGQEMSPLKKFIAPIPLHAGRFISEKRFPNTPKLRKSPVFIVGVFLSVIRKIKMGPSVNHVRGWICVFRGAAFAHRRDRNIPSTVAATPRYGYWLRNRKARPTALDQTTRPVSSIPVPQPATILLWC